MSLSGIVIIVLVLIKSSSSFSSCNFILNKYLQNINSLKVSKYLKERPTKSEEIIALKLKELSKNKTGKVDLIPVLNTKLGMIEMKYDLDTEALLISTNINSHFNKLDEIIQTIITNNQLKDILNSTKTIQMDEKKSTVLIKTKNMSTEKTTELTVDLVSSFLKIETGDNLIQLRKSLQVLEDEKVKIEKYVRVMASKGENKERLLRKKAVSFEKNDHAAGNLIKQWLKRYSTPYAYLVKINEQITSLQKEASLTLFHTEYYERMLFDINNELSIYKKTIQDEFFKDGGLVGVLQIFDAQIKSLPPRLQESNLESTMNMIEELGSTVEFMQSRIQCQLKNICEVNAIQDVLEF